MRYDWSLLEPYLDNKIEVSSRNQGLAYLTPREFRDFIVGGETLTSLIEKGYARHLVSFLSCMALGKITIAKESFVADYESGMSLDDMSEKHGIPRANIGYIRALFGIKCKGAKFQHRKKTETPFSQRQIEIMYGSLFGDAKKVSSSAIGFGHGTMQRDYLLWKYLEFENQVVILPKHSTNLSTSGRTLHDYRFYTKASTDAEKAIGIFYRNGDKQVAQEALDRLTSLSVAIWYQDDGVTGFNERLSARPAPTCCLCTDSFSVDSCLLIVKWFEQTHGIDMVLRKTDGGLFRAHAAGYSDSHKLIDLIRPHVLPMFAYKIDHDAYLTWQRKAHAIQEGQCPYDEPDMLKALANMRATKGTTQ